MSVTEDHDRSMAYETAPTNPSRASVRLGGGAKERGASDESKTTNQT